MRANVLSIVLVAAIAALAVPAARCQEMPSQYQPEAAGFDLLLNQDYEPDGTSVLVAGVAVPYRRLVFFLRSGRYEASYRVYLELFDSHDQRIRGEVWEETVSTGVFRETTSGASFARSSRRFALSPGAYKAVVTVEVIGTSRRSKREGTIRIAGGASDRLDLSDPSFQLLKGDSTVAKPRAGEIPVSLCPADTTGIGRQGPVFGIVGAFARARYNLIIPAAALGRVVLSARVRDASGTVVRYQRRTFSDLPAGRALVCLEMNMDDWRLGLYTIETIVEAPRASQRRESDVRFTLLLNSGLFGPHVDDLAAILRTLAKEDEVRAITEAPPAQRFEAWSAFWRKRDPTPSTPGNEAFGDFMARLRTVIERFSREQPGWMTDQGRVYLTEGPPDSIERQGDVGSKSYELWYYNSKGIVYIFEDIVGTGDYRLLTTRMI